MSSKHRKPHPLYKSILNIETNFWEIILFWEEGKEEKDQYHGFTWYTYKQTYVPSSYKYWNTVYDLRW